MHAVIQLARSNPAKGAEYQLHPARAAAADYAYLPCCMFGLLAVHCLEFKASMKPEKAAKHMRTMVTNKAI